MCDTSKVSKFKAGDKVVRSNRAYGSVGWDNFDYVTVSHVKGDMVYAEETGAWVGEDEVEFYDLPTIAKRQQLVAAIILVQSYNIGMSCVDGELWADGAMDKAYTNPRGLVNVLLPLESPVHKKLKELGAQQRAIADQMEKLRAEL
jgi:hypothetical protein